MERLFLATASADDISDQEMAICASEIPDGAPKWVKLMPLGNIVAGDGRSWSNANPEQVVKASQDIIDHVVDYEHQTDLAKTNGRPAPAAGWIKKMEVRTDGIYGLVEWTAKASAYLKAKEYRYLSPTFMHNKAGEVVRIMRAALTNNPAIHELPALAKTQETGNLTMTEEERKALAKQLGLSEDATVEQIMAMATKQAAAAATAEEATALNAVTCSALDLAGNASADDISSAITGLQAVKKPAADEFVDMATHQALAKDFKTLQDSTAVDKADDAVEKAMASGKVTPAQKDWAIAYATKDLKAFNDFVEIAPQIVDPAASANQGDTKTLATKLTDDEKAMASALNVSEEDFLATKNEGAQ